MLQVLKYWLTGCLLLVPPLVAAEGIKSHLIDTGWLQKNLKNADVLILDASPSQIYTTKHIPGAVNIAHFQRHVLAELALDAENPRPHIRNLHLRP